MAKKQNDFQVISITAHTKVKHEPSKIDIQYPRELLYGSNMLPIKIK